MLAACVLGGIHFSGVLQVEEATKVEKEVSVLRRLEAIGKFQVVVMVGNFIG